MLKLPFMNESVTPIDSQIRAVMAEMDAVGVTSEKYPVLMEHLNKLYEMKAKSRRPPISKDTVAMVLGNLAGIIIIVAYEQKHVLTSKGLAERIPLRINQRKPY